jgi:hypothetical protein
MTINALESAVKAAILAQGNRQEANKAYLEFIKANFIIPIELTSKTDEPEVLYLVDNNQFFLPVFTSMDYFKQWAATIEDKIELLKLSGVDLLKGIGENVYVSLNIGTDSYKEFNAAELARMRSMILKIF